MLTLPRALTALAPGCTPEITFSHLFFFCGSICVWDTAFVKQCANRSWQHGSCSAPAAAVRADRAADSAPICQGSLCRFPAGVQHCYLRLFLQVIFPLAIVCCWLGCLRSEHLDLSVERFAKLFILPVFCLALLPGEMGDKAYLLVAAGPGQLRSRAGVKAAVSEQRAGLTLILNSQRAGSFSGDGVAPSFSLSVTARLFYCAHNALMGDITQLQQVQLQKQVAAICSLNAAI